jgi:hypothetical protein
MLDKILEIFALITESSGTVAKPDSQSLLLKITGLMAWIVFIVAIVLLIIE